MRSVLTLCVATLISVVELSAWVYPEHRDISAMAIRKLHAREREMLERMWREARRNHEHRLFERTCDTVDRETTSTIDFAAWPAIAGDHACSPAKLVSNVLATEWILDVADACALLKRRLADAERRDEHVNAMRDADIKLQRVDPFYATRASSNNVHFLAARQAVSTTPTDYLYGCIQEGTPLNAIGAYTYFHASAMRKASRYATDRMLSEEQRSALAIAALADEAFALHFLEDAFASGHVAGTWGDASVRKGTHDHYCEHGLAVSTWDNKQAIIMGDAYMRPTDVDRASDAVMTSLEDFLHVASGHMTVSTTDTSLLPNAFDVCANTLSPKIETDTTMTDSIAGILVQTPIPGLADGEGSLPRFRTELGPFVGVSPAVRSEGVSSGFGKAQELAGGVAGLEFAFKFGFGMDGILSEAGDGLVFFAIGTRLDAASSMPYVNDNELIGKSPIISAIPARSAYTLRLRLPFYLVPGDLILAAPLWLISHDAYETMAILAGNGGLIPWQAGIATPVGRFQFVLGREIGVSLFGYGDQENQALMRMATDQGDVTTLVSFKSVNLDFPFLELRTFHSFSMTQSSGFLFQLHLGADIPVSSTMISHPSIPAPDLRMTWRLGLRVAFDWRYYF